MLTLDQLKTKLEALDHIFLKFNLQRVLLYKGFGSSEEHDFNLVVHDSVDSNSIFEGVNICSLQNELKALLNCHVLISKKLHIAEEYRSRIYDAGGSVELLNANKPVSHHQLRSELDQYFGLNWSFDDISAPIQDTYQFLFNERDISPNDDTTENQDYFYKIGR